MPFDERPDRFIARADQFELELRRLINDGLVDVRSFRGRDLHADELMYEAKGRNADRIHFMRAQLEDGQLVDADQDE